MWAKKLWHEYNYVVRLLYSACKEICHMPDAKLFVHILQGQQKQYNICRINAGSAGEWILRYFWHFFVITVTNLAPVCDCLQEPRKACMGTRLVFILVSPLTEALSLFGTTWEWRTFCVTGGHCCQSMLVWSGGEHRETPVWDSSQDETMCTWTMCSVKECSCRPFKVRILNPLYILYNSWQKEEQLLPVIAIEVNLDHLLVECILRYALRVLACSCVHVCTDRISNQHVMCLHIHVSGAKPPNLIKLWCYCNQFMVW